MLESYYPGLQIYLKDRKPKTVKELAEIHVDDHYDHVHHRSTSTRDECRVNSNGRNRGDLNKQRESQVNKSTSVVDKTNMLCKCWRKCQLIMLDVTVNIRVTELTVVILIVILNVCPVLSTIKL